MIREFINLRDRLANSQHHAFLKVEKILLDMLRTQNQEGIKDLVNKIYPEEDEIKWEKLRDNRDFSVLVWYECEEER